METIVVDSSVIIKWLVVEPYSGEARRILGKYQSGTLALRAPDLLNAEIGNIVWKKHVLQGMAVDDAQMIVDAFHALTFNFTPAANLLDAAYHLAVAHRRSVYDMMYVALCQQEVCRFVTADEKLVNAIQSSIPNVIWVGDFK